MLGVLRRHPVATFAVLAVLARLPALTRPIRADEAGFLLVARAWDPQPDSMFGPFWVDRPPLLIAVFKGIDELGGETTLRLLGPVIAGVVVVLAAYVARLVGNLRAAPWAAAIAAALLSNPMIDVVAVKGELLALPLLLGSILLTLVAVRRQVGVVGARRPAWPAAPRSGSSRTWRPRWSSPRCCCSPRRSTGRLRGREALRLGLAGVVGAAVPVLATVGWALAAGVRLSTLWYAVYGFRSDAARVIADGASDAPQRRALLLVLIALGCGLLPVIAGLLVHLRALWRDDPPVVAATVAVVAFDVVALVAGGSYWQDYLLPLVPGAVLCVALVAGRPDRPGRIMRAVVVGSAVSALLAMVFWLVWNVTGQQEFDEVHTGEAIADAAEPGDTLVVFGGRADLQDTSGLSSPYPYLWSLPMRTRDPGYADLRALLAGPDAPTWLVEWVDFDAWSDTGVAELEQVVDEQYVAHGTGCNGATIYLLRGVDRPEVTPDCP